MEAGTVVALLSAGLAAIIAVSVPVMTFRLALRQDPGSVASRAAGPALC